MPTKPRVFVSYVRNNSRTVQRLVEALEGAGIDVWWDQRDLEPGDRWEEKVGEAIEHGHKFIACFSRQYLQRNQTYMNEELNRAIKRLRTLSRNQTWFIPVCINRCKVPNWSIGPEQTLDGLQWVELWRDWDEGIESIINAVRPKNPLPRVLAAELERFESDESDERARAVSRFGQMRHPEAARAIERALEDPSRAVQKAALAEIAQIPNQRRGELLARIAITEEHPLQAEAEEALRETKDPGAVGILVHGIAHCEGSQRKQTVAGLLQDITDARAVPVLIQALDSPEHWTRYAAAFLLRLLRDRRAVTALAATAAHDPMPFVRSMAVSALGKTQDRRVMRPLIEATTDRDGRVSTAAEVAISEIHEPWRIPFLVRALRHTSACVRVIAVSNLWDVKDPTVMRALLSLVEDEDRSVRRALAVCPELPRGRKPPMAQVALGELSAARAKSRRCAAAMLGWLKWGPAVDALTGALHDRDEGVVICAVTALGSIGDPRAVDALTELLSDSRQAVRRAARRALKDLGITRPSQRPRQPRLPFPGDRPRW